MFPFIFFHHASLLLLLILCRPLIVHTLELRIPFCFGFLFPSISKHLFHSCEREMSPTLLCSGCKLEALLRGATVSSILEWD